MNESALIAVLASGGLDSSVLVGDLARQGRQVQPIFIRAGLRWESTELDFLTKFLRAIPAPGLRPLVVLDMPVRDLYGEHWSLTGNGVPDAVSPDAAVYLPGRNLLLLLKAMLWCHLQGVPTLALAVLQGNPFPDATAEFFTKFTAVVNAGVRGELCIERPYGRLSKVQVVDRGRGLPLQWTMSCIQPVHGEHCGACNKCAERSKAFKEAGMADPAEFV